MEDDLLNKFLFSLKEHARAELTCEQYICNLKLFFKFLGRDPLTATLDDIRRYQVHLVDRKLAPRTINGKIGAVKFFYTKTLRQQWPIGSVPWVKVKRKLPIVLSPEEVSAAIRNTPDLKQQTMLMAIYACGLRTCEVLSLTYKDIDSKTNFILVHGKGGKDRYVPLPKSLLLALRKYWVKTPDDKSIWLFPMNGRPGEQYHRTTIRRAYQWAKARAGIRKPGGLHQLRHSYATRLMELGVDLRIIQILLGHTLISTTTRYTQLRAAHAGEIKNPLDLIVESIDPQLKASGQS